MLIAWSGHRPDVFSNPRAAREAVYRVAGAKAAPDAKFICGGQRGVDQWAAQAAAKQGLSFHLVLPSDPSAFTRDWLPAERSALVELLDVAASVEMVDPEGSLGPLAYDLRNEVILRRAGLLTVVWTGIRRGGTFHTICAARMRGLRVEQVRLKGGGDQRSGAGARGL